MSRRFPIGKEALKSLQAMFRIYIYEDLEHFRDSDFERACAIVTEARIAKANGYLHVKDRNLSVIAELMLRYALRDAFSIREMPEMIFSEYGKPLLRDKNMPHFNISHCDLAVACAVSDRRIGIDIEPYSSYSEDIAKEVLDESELAYAMDSPSRFAELWTRKESYLKYRGKGLIDEIKTLLQAHRGMKYYTYHGWRGYACSVCTDERACVFPEVIDKDELFNALCS